MYRNSPVRNPRAKGIKVKNVLQVCLLVAVCFWLIFQLKRSHDKRKEFDASDGKVSLSTVGRSGEEIAKLGRKDLQPKLEKTGIEGEGEGDGREQEEEEVQDERDEDKREEEEQDERDENKHEEEEQDEDKIEEEKDDGRDDDIDENEQEKTDVEIDREEVDVIGEEKETEESEEKENENEEVSEEKDGQSQTENEVSSVEHNEEGDTEHTHEAREENYKADDASSAVTHTGRTLGTENEIKNGTIVALSENVGQTAENGTSTSTNTTVIQEKDPEPLISDVNPASSINSSENGPPSDTTLITNSTEISNSEVTESNTEVTEASSNSTEISNSEVTESNESSSDPSKTELETETNNVTEVIEETVDPDEVQHDPIDSTDLTHLEEKDVRTDLDTLPDIVTEGGNSEDTAAE